MTELWCLMWDRALTPAERETLTAMLPPRRRQRLPALPQRQAEPLCAYGLLRLALWERHGVRELPAIALSNHGKPYFPAFPQLHFSISHTEGAVLVGLSDRAIGVDIERLRPVSDGLAERFGAGSAEAFFQGWVRREARAKRTGTPVELGEESPLAPGEQLWYPEALPGCAACVSFTGQLRRMVSVMSLEQLLL